MDSASHAVGSRQAKSGLYATPLCAHRSCAGDLMTQKLKPGQYNTAFTRPTETHPCISTFGGFRSEEHTSELQSLMCNSYAVFCLKKKNNIITSHQSITYPYNTNKHCYWIKPSPYL